MVRRILLAAAIATCSVASGAEVGIKLLQTSDVHGNYFPRDFIRRTSGTGSLARVASVLDEYRSRYGNDKVLIVDNGDILQGQPAAYYYNYVDTASTHVAAEMLGYLGYTAVNVGNHDVETGRKVLERWASQCEPPVLCANIIDTSTGEPAFKPYTVVERDGVKIAILGMITPAIPAWLPEQSWHGWRFDDMEETARKWVPEILVKEHPDVMVGLFHAGQAGNLLAGYRENPSLDIATRVPGFDIVLMGHDHRREARKVVNCVGDSVLVIDPASGADVISDITINIEKDARGNVIGKHISGKLLDVNTYSPSASFMDHFAPQGEAVEAYVGEEIGAIADSVSTRDAYFGSSKFIDLLHRLQLDITGAEVSFCAPLSFDASIPAGKLYMSDMFNLYKYENMLYVMELTGREIKDYLEESYAGWATQMSDSTDHLLLFRPRPDNGEAGRSILANPTYNFDSAAGINYRVDVTKPRGERVNIEYMADGAPYDMERKYKVALNSYRGNGGGELLTKGAGIPASELKSRIVSATPRDLRHYFTEHIRSVGTLLPVSLNQWRFEPVEWTVPAGQRDRLILFPDENKQLPE